MSLEKASAAVVAEDLSVRSVLPIACHCWTALTHVYSQALASAVSRLALSLAQVLLDFGSSTQIASRRRGLALWRDASRNPLFVPAGGEHSTAPCLVRRFQVHRGRADVRMAEKLAKRFETPAAFENARRERAA